MTEEEARQWIRDQFGVSRETLLEHFALLLRAESVRQNLISAASFDVLWTRHFVDSAQLGPLAGDFDGTWLDVGTGAGMPGLVVALLTEAAFVLVEPRARRAAFLAHCASELGISTRVQVEARRIEGYQPTAPVAVVSARAVAGLTALLASTQHCADSSTIWLLPKGQSAHSEVEAARRNWQGVFHVEPSITQPDSGIVVATGVGPR